MGVAAVLPLKGNLLEEALKIGEGGPEKQVLILIYCGLRTLLPVIAAPEAC